MHNSAPPTSSGHARTDESRHILFRSEVTSQVCVRATKVNDPSRNSKLHMHLIISLLSSSLV